MPAQRGALGLWALVLVQLAIPARYYGHAAGADDERFAWRMFSDVRFRRCEVHALELSAAGERSLQLEQALHASWIGLLRRGRPAVIEAFLRQRCTGQRLRAVSLRRACREVDGISSFVQSYRLECASGSLSLEQERP